jgi:hypothetical protein
MKLKVLGLTAVAALLALQSTTASAGTDVFVGIELGAPVVVERRPVYRHYYEPDTVVYTESYVYPRTYVYRERYVTRYDERHYHDNGWHRGHHKRRHHRH